jgi:hypothetical protein
MHNLILGLKGIQRGESMQTQDKTIEERIEEERRLIAREVNKILEMKNNLDVIVDPKESKDRIIKILRDEIDLLKIVSRKILFQKDQQILELKNVIEEKNNTIKGLKRKAHYQVV